jgi:hypothetical protein
MSVGMFLGEEEEERFAMSDLAVYFFPEQSEEFCNRGEIYNVEEGLSEVIGAKEVRLIKKYHVGDMIGRTVDAIIVRYPGSSMKTPSSINSDLYKIERCIDDEIDPEWGVVPV